MSYNLIQDKPPPGKTRPTEPPVRGAAAVCSGPRSRTVTAPSERGPVSSRAATKRSMICVTRYGCTAVKDVVPSQSESVVKLLPPDTWFVPVSVADPSVTVIPSPSGVPRTRVPRTVTHIPGSPCVLLRARTGDPVRAGYHLL